MMTYPGIPLPLGLSLNLYTAPAYLASAMNVFGALALHFLFKEEYAGLEERPIDLTIATEAEGEESVDENIRPAKRVPPFDRVAVMICWLTRFTQQFISTNIETIGIPAKGRLSLYSRYVF